MRRRSPSSSGRAGAGLSDDRNAPLRRLPHRGFDGLERGFELDEDDIRRGERVVCLDDVVDGEERVGPGGDGDAVLPAFVHVDQGDAGRRAGRPEDEPRVEAVGLEIRQGPFAEDVVADAGDEGHAPPGAGRGHGLVRPLAARRHGERAAQDRLSGPRDAGHTDDHVRVGAADDQDVLHRRVRPRLSLVLSQPGRGGVDGLLQPALVRCDQLDEGRAAPALDGDDGRDDRDELPQVGLQGLGTGEDQVTLALAGRAVGHGEIASLDDGQGQKTGFLRGPVLEDAGDDAARPPCG